MRPSARRSATGVGRRMDGEDRLPQRATPSRLPDRWDLSVHPGHAPDALFLLGPEREGFPMWIGPLAAVG